MDLVANTHEPDVVAPLRLRYNAASEDVVDIAWSRDPDETHPPSVAFLNLGVIHPAWKSSCDLEDPSIPDNDVYPPYEAADLTAGDFGPVRR